MPILMERIAPYSITLLCALLTLMQWCKWRYRFARRYRSAVSAALAPEWFTPKARLALVSAAEEKPSTTARAA
jgi:hypothetical protein